VTHALCDAVDALMIPVGGVPANCARFVFWSAYRVMAVYTSIVPIPHGERSR
jgi:hypothetical protein